MPFARVLVQECKPGTVEALTRSAEDTFLPRLRRVPGFISYHVVKLDDRSLIAIAFLETRGDRREGADRGRVARADRQGRDRRRTPQVILATGRS